MAAYVEPGQKFNPRGSTSRYSMRPLSPMYLANKTKDVGVQVIEKNTIEGGGSERKDTRNGADVLRVCDGVVDGAVDHVGGGPVDSCDEGGGF